MIQEETPNIWETGSHWNRSKLSDEGTGIHWNTKHQMWEVKIVRHGGYFESLDEATMAMNTYLKSTGKTIENGAKLMAKLKEYEAAGLLSEAIVEVQEKISLE